DQLARAGDDDERGVAAGPLVLHPEREVPAVGVDGALLDEDLPRELDLHEVVLEGAEGLARGGRERPRGGRILEGRRRRGGGVWVRMGRGAPSARSVSLTGWIGWAGTRVSSTRRRSASRTSRALNSAVSSVGGLERALAERAGPAAAILSSTRRTMRLAPACR